VSMKRHKLSTKLLPILALAMALAGLQAPDEAGVVDASQDMVLLTMTSSPEEVFEGDLSTFIGYSITLENQRSLPIRLDSLMDDTYGDVTTSGHDGIDSTNCSVPQIIAAGDAYVCLFTVVNNGVGGEVRTNTLTAAGATNEPGGEPFSVTDDATVVFLAPCSSLSAFKGPDPSFVVEPGGAVAFTVGVTNNLNADEVTITSLLDNVYWDLNGQGSCILPFTLAPGETSECTFSGLVTGNASEDLVNEIVIRGITESGAPLRFDVGATVSVVAPPEDAQGCGPGYWRQEQHLDSWVTVTPDQDYESTFDVDASFTATLLEALRLNGGGERALARHAVAALLNINNPDVSYAIDASQLNALVQNAYITRDFESAKDILETHNERGCPLN
jgi:hypothetical protein